MRLSSSHDSHRRSEMIGIWGCASRDPASYAAWDVICILNICKTHKRLMLRNFVILPERLRDVEIGKQAKPSLPETGWIHPNCKNNQYYFITRVLMRWELRIPNLIIHDLVTILCKLTRQFTSISRWNAVMPGVRRARRFLTPPRGVTGWGIRCWISTLIRGNTS